MALPPIEKLREAAEAGGIDVSDLGSRKTEIIARLESKGVSVGLPKAEPDVVLDVASDLAPNVEPEPPKAVPEPVEAQVSEPVQPQPVEAPTPPPVDFRPKEEPATATQEIVEEEESYEYHYPTTQQVKEFSMLPVGAFAVDWSESQGWGEFVMMVGSAAASLSGRVIDLEVADTIARAIAPVWYNVIQWSKLDGKPSLLIDAIAGCALAMMTIATCPEAPATKEEFEEKYGAAHEGASTES